MIISASFQSNRKCYEFEVVTSRNDLIFNKLISELLLLKSFQSSRYKFAGRSLNSCSRYTGRTVGSHPGPLSGVLGVGRSPSPEVQIGYCATNAQWNATRAHERSSSCRVAHTWRRTRPDKYCAVNPKVGRADICRPSRRREKAENKLICCSTEMLSGETRAQSTKNSLSREKRMGAAFRRACSSLHSLTFLRASADALLQTQLNAHTTLVI